MRLLLVTILLSVGVVRGARAEVEGEIFGPGATKFPIAVSPLKGSAADGGRFAKVLSRDLDLSGYFRMIDPQQFPEDPQSSGTTADAIDFDAWSATGAQALVKGTVVSSGNGVTVEVRVFDLGTKQEVSQVSRRFVGGRTEIGRMANRSADALLEFLTGERGPFDSKIAFVSNRAGRLKDVYLFTFDRDEPERVSTDQSIVMAPRWRPDLRGLLYASYREHVPRLFGLDLGSRQSSRLTSGGPFLSGAWSPDGQRILAVRELDGNSEIVLLDANGTVIRQLTDHWAIDVSPAWSPDGRKFAFCSSRGGAPQIYVADVDGGAPKRISFRGNYNTSPAWSPKGDAIAYATRVGGSFQIIVGDADGQNTIAIPGNGEDPSWAPDGRYIVYDGRRHLMMADRTGKSVKELTHGNADDSAPAWSPRLEPSGR